MRLDALGHLEAVDPRHADVEQHGCEVAAGECRQRLLAVPRLDDRRAGRLEERGQRQERRLVVVDDQQANVMRVDRLYGLPPAGKFPGTVRC
jgi:hypothetical protein